MQPRVTTAGPIIAASATKIALSQTVPAVGYLALNGAAGASTANNICTTQAGTAATALTLNGALNQTLYVNPIGGFTAPKIAMLPNQGSPVTITSAGNDSGITFAVVGTAPGPQNPPIVIKETITGSNTSIVASANIYQTIISITPSGNTAANVTVGAMGLATLDTARNIIFTSAGNDSGITFALSGTDAGGNSISETVTGANAGVAVSALAYLTVKSIKASAATASTLTVGTSGVAISPWINLDPWAMGTISGQCAVSGVVNYTVQISDDDPNSYANPITPSAMVWDSDAAGVVNQTTSQSFGLPYAPLWIRVLLNSETGTGSVRMTVVQHNVVGL